MKPLERTAAYKRDPKTRGQVAPYEEKFAALIKLCKKAKEEGVGNVVVTWPWVLGDTHDELIESLSRFAEAGLAVHIVERCAPGKPHLPKVSQN